MSGGEDVFDGLLSRPFSSSALPRLVQLLGSVTVQLTNQATRYARHCPAGTS
jgi:hypothetical protein